MRIQSEKGYSTLLASEIIRNCTHAKKVILTRIITFKEIWILLISQRLIRSGKLVSRRKQLTQLSCEIFAQFFWVFFFKGNECKVVSIVTPGTHYP